LGTLVTPTTVSVFDIFGDGSAVALYRFEGNANDDGGNYNGSWTGNEQYDVGKFGQAAKFDGSSRIEVPVPTSSLTNITYSFWLYYTSYGSGTDVSLVDEIDENNGALGALSVEFNGDKIEIGCGDGSSTNVYQASVPTTNEWHHVVGILDWDNKKLKLYIDTVLVASGDITLSSLNALDSIKIGGNKYSNNNYITGLVDQLRIFNRALTDEEVQILYKEMIGG